MQSEKERKILTKIKCQITETLCSFKKRKKMKTYPTNIQPETLNQLTWTPGSVSRSGGTNLANDSMSKECQIYCDFPAPQTHI